MTDTPPSNEVSARSRKTLWVLLGLVVASCAVLLIATASRNVETPVTASSPLPVEATSEQVHQFCGTACHAYPPADAFPRRAWRREIKQAYDFFRDSNLQIEFPSQESVAIYYEKRAPEELPIPKHEKPVRGPSVQVKRQGFDIPSTSVHPAVSNVNLVHLLDPNRLDILVCEARLGRILVLQPYTQPPTWHVLYANGPNKGFNPAHAEVVDLDGDGIPDILVANLGYFGATDAPCGSVVWLRGLGNGKYEPYTLLDKVGRVADVQAADFRGVGKLDLVVAAFGWRNTGAVYYLENQTLDSKQPRFVPRVLDGRHGAIHVPVGDIDGDGKPDIVALISQEHETIVAFLNTGSGFRKETIYTAPHPAYGSSGIQLTDLNGDGKLDVLYTNGDSLDPPYLLKPYHGIQWLENQGKFPFEHHPITSMHGVMRAVAADFTGRGGKDILAVSFLSAEDFPQRDKLQLDSIILLEQIGPGKYDRHTLETSACDHFTCAVGDLFGDGIPHLVTGSFGFSEDRKIEGGVTIWHNSRGPR